MDLPAGPARRLLLRLRACRQAASEIDYAVLIALIAVAVLGAVVLTGDRVRSLFMASEETVGDGVAGLPLPTPPGGDGGTGGAPPPPAGQGAWSGSGTFALTPTSTPQARAFTVTNVGTDLLVLGAPAFSGTGAPAFDVLSSDCGALPPGDSCEVLVQATASANGTATATLSIAGVPGGVVLSRTASGFNPALAWSGGGAFVIDGTPDPDPLPRTAQQTFTLGNYGFADATGVAPVLTGPDADAFSLTTDCPPVLPQGAVCTVTVTAAASDNGSLAATLSSGGATPATQSLSATATGFAATLAWTSVPADFSMNTASGGVAQPTTPAPGPVQSATLTNTGTLASGPLTIALAGPDATAFQISNDTCSGQPIAPGASCSLDVRLAAGLFPGDYSLQLTATASSTVAAPARTQRVVGPRLQIVSDQFDPGPATLDHAAWDAFGNAREVRYQNTGNAPTGPMTATNNSGLGFIYTHALVGSSTHPITDSVPGGTLDLAPGETGRLRIRLRDGGHLSGLRTLVIGPNTFSTGPVAIGGFPLPTMSGTYTGSVAAAWGVVPSANTLDVATQSLAAPTNAAAGPTGTFTLQNTGTLPLDGISIALAGTNPASYERNGDICATSLLPGATCTVGIRLVAGQFPATYQVALRATATGLTATDSAQTSQRVVGPRLQITGEHLVNVSHNGNYVNNVSAFQVTNIGNAATPNVEVAGSGLIRSDFNNVAEGRGFIWALYDSANVVFPSGVLDSYERPSTNPDRLRSVPAGGGLVLHVGLGWAELLGNPTPPANYTTSVQMNFSTGGSLVLTPAMSATCGSPCRN